MEQQLESDTFHQDQLELDLTDQVVDTQLGMTLEDVEDNGDNIFAIDSMP